MVNLIEPSRFPPVTMEEVKRYLKIDYNDDDETIAMLINSATRWVENFLGRSLLAQTWQVIWQRSHASKPALLSPEFEDFIKIPLPFPPLMDVKSVNLLFPNMTRQNTKRFIVEINGGLPEVVLSQEVDQVEVVYKAGYGETPKDIPEDIRQAILLKTCAFYENRQDHDVKESSVITSLLQPYRVMRLAA